VRYDANHKERTRALLLAEAAAAIRSEGPDRVAVSRIMAAAGLTHGGFYAHFPSKDDLIAQAVTYMFDAAYSVFLSATEGRTPADALANYIDVYLSPSKRDDRAHALGRRLEAQGLHRHRYVCSWPDSHPRQCRRNRRDVRRP